MLNLNKYNSAVALSKWRQQKQKPYITERIANAQLNNDWLDSCLSPWRRSKAGQIYSTAIPIPTLGSSSRRQAGYRNWLPALAALAAEKWRHEPFVSRTTTITTLFNNSWSNGQWRKADRRTNGQTGKNNTKQLRWMFAALPFSDNVVACGSYKGGETSKRHL